MIINYYAVAGIPAKKVKQLYEINRVRFQGLM